MTSPSNTHTHTHTDPQHLEFSPCWVVWGLLLATLPLGSWLKRTRLSRSYWWLCCWWLGVSRVCSFLLLVWISWRGNCAGVVEHCGEDFPTEQTMAVSMSPESSIFRFHTFSNFSVLFNQDCVWQSVFARLWSIMCRLLKHLVPGIKTFDSAEIVLDCQSSWPLDLWWFKGQMAPTHSCSDQL